MTFSALDYESYQMLLASNKIIFYIVYHLTYDNIDDNIPNMT